MDEQGRVLIASFALMGILQRIDAGNTNKAHYCDQAWQWADAASTPTTTASGDASTPTTEASTTTTGSDR